MAETLYVSNSEESLLKFESDSENSVHHCALIHSWLVVVVMMMMMIVKK
jgi:hypothetical protein